jgi:hypothetical protein
LPRLLALSGLPLSISLVSYIIQNFGKAIALFATCFHVGFLSGLFFDPEYGDEIFFQNVN